MESGTFYWQPNGNDEVRLSTTITSNDYILKTNDTPSQEVTTFHFAGFLQRMLWASKCFMDL